MAKVGKRVRSMLVAGLAALSLGGCYYDDINSASYGQYGTNYAAACDNVYGSDYWRADPYGYNDGYGYDCYDPRDYRGGFVQIGFGGGWFNDFYYPGHGLFLFDRGGYRHPLNDYYLSYWGGRRAWWRHHGSRGYAPQRWRSPPRHYHEFRERRGNHRDDRRRGWSERDGASGIGTPNARGPEVRQTRPEELRRQPPADPGAGGTPIRQRDWNGQRRQRPDAPVVGTNAPRANPTASYGVSETADQPRRGADSGMPRWQRAPRGDGTAAVPPRRGQRFAPPAAPTAGAPTTTVPPMVRRPGWNPELRGGPAAAARPMRQPAPASAAPTSAAPVSQPPRSQRVAPVRAAPPPPAPVSRPARVGRAGSEGSAARRTRSDD